MLLIRALIRAHTLGLEKSGEEGREAHTPLHGLCTSCQAGAAWGLRAQGNAWGLPCPWVRPRAAPARALHRAAHLEVIQHLLPGQEQQGLFPDLPGNLRVEEGILAAAIGHPLGTREKNQNGGPCPGQGEGLGPGTWLPMPGPSWFRFNLLLPVCSGGTPLPTDAPTLGASTLATVMGSSTSEMSARVPCPKLLKE